MGRSWDFPARMTGVSLAARSITVAAVVTACLLPPPATAATAAPAGVGLGAIRIYPLQQHSLPHELRRKARAKLPKIAARVMTVIGRNMDQEALLPVQMVSALHIRNAFRSPRLSNRAWRIAIRVAWRESRLLPNVVNDTNWNKTEDWGLFQLNDGGTLQYVGGTPGPRALQPRWNARAAARLVASVGWDPWRLPRTGPSAR